MDESGKVKGALRQICSHGAHLLYRFRPWKNAIPTLKKSKQIHMLSRRPVLRWG